MVDGAVPALGVDRLVKSYGPAVVLKGVSLEVAPGEVHALLGENGSGKSTLIKALAGYHRPDSGVIRVAGEELSLGDPAASYRMGFRFVHQDLGLIGSLSIADNLSLSGGYDTRLMTVKTRDERRRARKDLDVLGIDVDVRTLVADLPPATRTGVAVARALRADPDAPVRVLVMDEPTAASPADEAERIMSLVRAAAATGAGVLYVTHRLEEVFQIADTVTVIRDGQKVATRPARDLHRRQIISYLTGNDLFEDAATASAQAQAEAEPKTHDKVLEVRELAGVELAGVSLGLRQGEVLGVAGITGSGRETLLPTIFGALPHNGGSIALDRVTVDRPRPDRSLKLGMAYLPPDRKAQGGLMDLTARENMTIANLSPLWKRLWLNRKQEMSEAQGWIDKLSVRPADAANRALSTLSGGNQQKILLSRLLRLQPRILLLDEPTQGVDIPSKAVIYEHMLAAASAGCAVLVASSDPEELAALCQRVIVLRDGRIAAELTGDQIDSRTITVNSLGAFPAAA